MIELVRLRVRDKTTRFLQRLNGLPADISLRYSFVGEAVSAWPGPAMNANESAAPHATDQFGRFLQLEPHDIGRRKVVKIRRVRLRRYSDMRTYSVLVDNRKVPRAHYHHAQILRRIPCVACLGMSRIRSSKQQAESSDS